MRFSLVIPTLDRPDTIRLFFEGLTRQSVTDLEVIVVDQSGSDIYERVLEDFAGRWPIRHVRSDVRKCRYACAVGAGYATGEIIAFPDDDCIYLPDTLERVDAHFRKDPDLGLLTGAVVNLEQKKTSMGRWMTASRPLNQENIWLGLMEFNMFIRRDLYEKVGGFDINMGPGNYFVAAEGQDLALRLLRQGVKGYFDVDLRVMHPDKSVQISLGRARAYARGMGYALRKNHAPVNVVATYMVRPIGGIFWNLVRGNLEEARYFLGTLLGRLEGYCASEAVAARATSRVRVVEGTGRT